MKKVKFFALMFLAGATLFTSCKKDEETDVPTISVSLKTGYDLNAWKGDTIKWTVTMGSNEKLATLKVEPNVGNSGTNVMNQTLDGTSQTVEYAYVVPGAGINDGDHIAITFTVTDNKEGTNNTIQTLTMVAPVVNTPFATEVTAGTFYHIAGLLHGAYDLDGDATVGSSGTASTKSMVNTDVAGATFTGSWASDAANATQYVKTTTAYADIYQENAATLYTDGTASTTVTNPAANDVYIGKKGTTYYVISILTVEPTYSDNTGNNHGRITFKYKK